MTFLARLSRLVGVARWTTPPAEPAGDDLTAVADAVQEDVATVLRREQLIDEIDDLMREALVSRKREQLDRLLDQRLRLRPGREQADVPVIPGRES